MINRRFLLNAILLTALISGGAYFIASNGGEEMDGMVPMTQEMPPADSVSVPVVSVPVLIPESVSNAVPAGSPVTVSISNFAYGPEVLRVKPGTKVIWRNEDGVKHNVLADNGEFSSKLLGKGELFELTFNQKGIFPYHCGPHPWMKATVIVE